MKSIAVSEFKARCLTLLEDVASTGEALLVTKRGKPLARVVPSGNSAASNPQDTLRGTVEILGDVLEPALPPSAWNAVRGVLLSQDEKRSKPKAKAKRRATTPKRRRP